MHKHWTRVRAELPSILTVPGLDGSGPDHWQTEWEYHLPDCRRVQMGDWSHPVRERWVERLDRALAGLPGTAVLAAHSLGCLAVAWWARQNWQHEHRHKMLGAMLVAPPCPDASPVHSRIAEFCPAPKQRLPFPTLLVASRNDPHSSFETSELLAEAWGSQLVDVGHLGHINAESQPRRVGTGHRPRRRTADLGGRRRKVFARTRTQDDRLAEPGCGRSVACGQMTTQRGMTREPGRGPSVLLDKINRHGIRRLGRTASGRLARIGSCEDVG